MIELRWFSESEFSRRSFRLQYREVGHYITTAITETDGRVITGRNVVEYPWQDVPYVYEGTQPDTPQPPATGRGET